MEREKRFELSTLSLATRCSTTELFPLGNKKIPDPGDQRRRTGPRMSLFDPMANVSIGADLEVRT